MLKQAPEQQICLGLDITTGFIIVAGNIVGRIVEDPCNLHEDSHGLSPCPLSNLGHNLLNGRAFF
jgi:hypothetical protein